MPDLTATENCPKCRRSLPPDATRGLCVKCLFAAALDGGPLEAAPETMAGSLVFPRSFGAHELLEEVARGGMGIVYRGRQRQINRLVAVKVLAAGAFASPDARQRFRTEAEAVACLDHANIVPIYDVGEEEGQPYFTMRFLEGGTLAQRLAGSPTPPDPRDAAVLIAKLARAVHHAHQRGILHRDIKPGNVLLDLQGEPYLSDFGLARLMEQESTLTHTMAMLGTPSYMSPEQARGGAKNLTTATDVYSLGAIFYELLAGRPPFLGGSTMETVRMVLDHEPPRLSRIRNDLDPDLATICFKCLEKDPASRYGSAEGLADDLERWLRHETIRARRASPAERTAKWIRRHKAGFAALITVAVLLPVALAVTSWQAVRATRAEALANRRLMDSQASESRALKAEKEATERAAAEAIARKNSQAVSIFMMNVFSGNDPGRDGRTVTVAEKLATAAKQVQMLTAFPEQQKEVLLALGRSYLGLQLPKEATPLLARYCDFCRTNYGPNDRQTFSGEFLLATAYELGGRVEEGRALREDLLRRERETLGMKDPTTLHTMHVLGKLYATHGPREKLIPLREEYVRLRTELFGRASPQALDATEYLADAYGDVGRFDDEARLREELLEGAIDVQDAKPGKQWQALNHLALACLRAGRKVDALAHWSAALALNSADRIFDIKFAGLHVWFGNNAEHEVMAGRLARAVADTTNYNEANCVAKLASIRVLLDPEVREGAVKLACRAVELGRRSSRLAWFHLSLGMAEYRQEHFAAAEEALLEADAGAARHGARHRDLIRSTAGMYRAMSAFRCGDAAEAGRIFSQAALTMRPLPEDDHNPLAGAADHDDLVLWLAFKEARALLYREPSR